MKVFVANDYGQLVNLQNWFSESILVTKSVSLRDKLSSAFRHVIVLDTNIPFESQVKITAEQLKSYSPKQVFCFSETLMQFAGALRDLYGITGLGLEKSIILRNKIAMKDAFKRCGLKCADYLYAGDTDNLEQFLLRYPKIVVKPIWGTNTEDCHLIESSKFMDLCNTIKVDSYIIEEFIDAAEEYHVDALVSLNQDILFSCVSQYLAPMIYITHYGTMTGSVLGNERSSLDNRILEIFKKCVQCIGLSRCILHTEFLRCRHTGEIYISEIAGRPAGERVIDNVYNVFGINLIREHIHETVGLPLTHIQYENQPRAGAYLLLPAKPGRVIDFTDISDLRQMENVYEVTYDYEKGAIITIPEWLRELQAKNEKGVAKGRYKFGDVIIIGANKEQCRETARQVFEQFYLKTLY